MSKSMRIDVEKLLDILYNMKEDGYAIANLHIDRENNETDTLYISAVDIETRESISYGVIEDDTESLLLRRSFDDEDDYADLEWGNTFDDEDEW